MTSEKRPVTVEDLLRLKRAERPAAEFWEQFDRDLRAKQLAAIVEKGPWWRNLRLPAVLARGARFYVPVGAAAALAVTLLVTREDSAAPAVQLEPAVAIAAPAPVVESSVAAAPETPVADPAMREPLTAAPALVAATEEQASPSLAAVVAVVAASEADVGADSAAPFVQPATVSEALALGAMPIPADTPSGRFIAANLAAVQGEDPLAAAGQLFQPRLAELKVRQAKVEPLAQIAVPGSSRTNKILSARASAASYAPDSTRSSERAANRLSDDSGRIYDRGQGRIGGSASTFSFRL